ncbi:hypothetical protein [Serratia entomophila]|uniref:hypothetical protein n=1 Tax=Serratia entomophila TaxID=42906 RepID=UPI002177DB0D|nr:hypothetical protein [Serratia entomophila]CAI1006546.1 Uncharacterised protein [Serratia entomophila]CAI1554106.1 Uncharacterised protein [Serratia entomophila]CAI1656421.1 Uncharacterised protein [Serratia entomophila]CAI1712934.1 Uncharacterised protein [Serratia entomophila]CAI1797560.1 Uncharacterised protein [Serratia entomophila]
MNDYIAQIRRLRELGPRTSGNDAHRALISEVAAELSALGYNVQRDRHTFERWDASPDSTALQIEGVDVPLSSTWPYSGETGPLGVTAPLVLLRGRRKKWKAAAGKIAVIEIHNIDVPANLLLDSWGGELPFDTLANPVIGSELADIVLTKAREAGVLGVVAIWGSIVDEAAHGQYLPFTRDYQGIPAVWVPQSQRNAVLAAAERGKEATLTLDARKTEGATMDTLWAVSRGTGPQAEEAVLVVTHSDGGNAVEENGHLGLLALARDAAANAHNRTIVFVYTAGHLRIPCVTKHGQATTAWLAAHPECWSPEYEGLTAVAGLVIEHLGAKHFCVDPSSGQYGPDGTLEPELLYATTREFAQLALATWSGASMNAVVPVKPGALVHLGEGEPLFDHGIPAVALVTGPMYLLAETDADTVDIDTLTRQIDSFRRLLTHLASHVDSATFGVVSRPSKLRKLLAVTRVLLFMNRHRRI